MNAIDHNPYTDAWRQLGQQIPKPRAVLCVSAHWYIPGVAVTAMEWPRTIHDFGGFPPALYQAEYAAPGSPELACRVAALLSPASVRLDQSWGLDHGTWSVLAHLLPAADVPVIQLSLDETADSASHYQLAGRLAALRDQGVLILGSGNVVHNLRAYSWGDPAAAPYDWAVRFETTVRARLVRGDFSPLVAYQSLGPDASLSVPTPEHYLPLLYVIAQRQQEEALSFPVEGLVGGSISMLAVRIG